MIISQCTPFLVGNFNGEKSESNSNPKFQIYVSYSSGGYDVIFDHRFVKIVRQTFIVIAPINRD